MNIKPLFHQLKIELPHQNGDIELIRYSDILYITYDKPYTTFYYMENGNERKCVVEISLTQLEQKLPEVFFRCNPVAILNLCYLKKYEYAKKIIGMENGMEFLMSRRKSQVFRSKKALLPRLSPLCEPCLLCTHVCPVKNSFCSHGGKTTG